MELDAETVKGLLLAGVVEEIVMDKAAIDFRKAMEEKLSKVATEAAESGARKALETARASVSGVRIEMGVTEEEKVLATGGFKSFGHFAYEVYKAGSDGRNASRELVKYNEISAKVGKASGMSEGIDSDGGYLVPTQQATAMLEKSLEASIVRPRAQFVPMGTSSLDIPAIKDDSHSSTVFGGVRVYRKPEAAQATSSKPALKKVSLKLTKLMGLCYVTDELMSDSPVSIDALINRLFPSALSFWEDLEYLTGSGAGEPLGALNAANPALLAITAEAGQGADTIVVENILKMYARCAGKNNAVWVANHDTFVQLATMVLKVGTGGVPVWLPGNNVGVAGAPQGTLLGRPLILSELCPTVGDQGDIALVDFSQYLVGERAGEGVQSASSMHLRFDYGETAFRFTLRNDGQPWWTSVFTPRNGATMSPFVVLAAR
ncbi:MAG TPA: phage major capsid protein [Anaerolineae bacterium]|nr:phage major capsid protein [Anaerolineae bacterium]